MSDTKWTPCSKSLPKESGYYLVTREFFETKRVVDIVGFTTNLWAQSPVDFIYEDDCRPGWFSRDPEYGCCEQYTIIAWSELPEPYEGR